MGPDAVVVGGGIGGLAAAVALHRVGRRVLVLERSPTLEPVGAGLSLWPNALRALDALGVGRQVRAGAAISGASGIRRPDGSWLARSDVGSAVRRRYGDPLVVVHRAEVIDLLRAALPGDAVRTGADVTGVDPGGPDAPATVQFAEETITAPVVVGADGIRSRLRRDLFPDHPAPRYAGYTAWRVVVPATDPQLAGFETWGRRGERFAVVPMSGCRWYCYATADAAAGLRAHDEAAELVARFGSWHEPVASIVAGLTPDIVLHQDIEELGRPLPALHRGRVALLGDAAHAMTPDLGQGACQALEDAVELAAQVSRAPIEAALAAYTARRLPRTTAISTRSRRAGRIHRAPYAVQGLTARLMGLVPAVTIARGLDPVVRWDPPTL